MTTFLQRLVNHILADSSHPPDRTVIFQTRRAGLYFKHLFAKAATRTQRMPITLSIEDFVFQLCPLKIIDPTELLFEFYEVYRKRENADPFATFAGWAGTLLKDFDDIDAYMAPPLQLLEYVRNLQSMNAWSPGDEPSSMQQRYLEFWNEIPKWYDALQTRLLDQGLAYKGMAFRMVAGSISDLSQTIDRPIIFAGFNALSVSEETILKYLLREKKSEIFWDIDGYYFRDPMHEAGHFLRKHNKAWLPQMEWQSDELTKTAKSIKVIGAAQNIGQVRAAVQAVTELPSPDSTAIVLADENMLLPLLHHLPQTVGSFNISMGAKLSGSLLASFIKNLFDLHQGAVDGKFYHADLDRLFSGPFAEDLLTQESMFRIRGLMREGQLVWADPSILNNLVDKNVVAHIFVPWQSTLHAFDGLNGIIEYLREKWLENQQPPINIEFLFQWSCLVNRLRLLFDRSQVAANLTLLQSLMEELMRSSRVPFSGEPLVGLQIMGILETRSLDFDHVILLGLNENILPISKHQPSIIPFEARKWAQLPTHTERDAIYAYNFYRLLQRASTATLIYNTESDEFGRGEISRFVTQLIHELRRSNPSADIKQLIAVPPVGASRSTAGIEIPKDGPIMEVLRKRAVDGFSPSAINDLVACELRYYLKYVAGLREQDEVEETVESSTIGTAVHAVLQDAFVQIIGQVVQEPWLATHAQQSHQALLQAFKKELVYSLDTGKNKLIFDFSVDLLREFWRAESERSKGIPFRVVGIETESETMLTINTVDGSIPVKIKGRIDRIDESNGQIRIIDYKTGTPKELRVKSSDLSELLHNAELAIAFQLMTYALAYHDSTGKENIIPSAYWLRSTPAELKGIANQDTIDDFVMDRTAMEAFRTVLISLLESLFDSSKPFVQTQDEKRCSYCPFVVVCNRPTKELKF